MKSDMIIAAASNLKPDDQYIFVKVGKSGSAIISSGKNLSCLKTLLFNALNETAAGCFWGVPEASGIVSKKIGGWIEEWERDQ